MDTDSPDQPVYLPRGVSDPIGQVGYISNGVNGIDAINLLNGELLWSTDIAYKPLIVFGETLAALRDANGGNNVLQVVFLDLSQRGALALTSEPVVLPDWVSIHEDNGSLDLKAHLDRDDLVLSWECHTRYTGGAPPPTYIQAQEQKCARGQVRINLKSSEAKTSHSVEGNPIPLEEPLPDQIDDSVTKVWAIDDEVISLLSRLSDGKVAYYIKARDRLSEHSYDEIKLADGEALVASVTPDGYYVFIHQEVPPKAPSSDGLSWSVFSAKTGSLVAELTYERGAQQPCLVGGVVYYLVEKRSGSVVKYILKARELATNRIVWERVLQESQYAKPPALRQ